MYWNTAKNISWEFQYGKDVFQTTTNKTQNQASKDGAWVEEVLLVWRLWGCGEPSECKICLAMVT